MEGKKSRSHLIHDSGVEGNDIGDGGQTPEDEEYARGDNQSFSGDLGQHRGIQLQLTQNWLSFLCKVTSIFIGQ